MATFRAGYAALLGRPNVGKSTLLNRLLQHKISITSPKPQTTRHMIVGIQTLAQAQIVYVDTPGIHRNAVRAMNRHMNRAAQQALSFCQAAVMIVEALRWTDEDEDVANHLKSFEGPRFAAINKIDRLDEKAQLLPFLKSLEQRQLFQALVPISALKNDNLQRLEGIIVEALPESSPLFSEEQITTASQRFLAGELLREKLMRQLNQELPYAVTVEIERFEEGASMLAIDAIIWVERTAQKGIVIGEGGQRLKAIASAARRDMEQLFEQKVFLQTWVKVKAGWSDDERALRLLGYD